MDSGKLARMHEELVSKGYNTMLMLYSLRDSNKALYCTFE